ncbi:MAG TPA: ABC transporter permease [Pyrinomonadaceae bacterium]|jgi:ABC-type multidrug transport system permease subunit|nr:ABC transporter permease [Pyrinomonadaceae bacterium]
MAEEGIGISPAKTQRREEEPGAIGDAKTESLHPLLQLTATRVREFVREKEAVFWVFIFPVLMTFALGVAFRNTAPDKTPIAIEATANAKANELAQVFSNSPDITATVMSPSEAAQALRSGKISIVVKPQNDSFEYRFDPTRPESRTARLIVDDALQRGKGRADVVKIGEERITEPGARYVDFLVPGLIGMNLMGSGLWGLGFTVVIARSRKILKRFAATPMRRSHYLFSFMLSRLVFLVLEVGAVVVFAWLVFNFTVRGSWLTLILVTMLGGFTFSGLGLLVAARPTTIEGVSGLMNFIMLPMWLLSGTFFSSERFPQVLQPFIKALPLTALNTVLRSVMNEGAALTSNWAPMSIMLAWCLISFVIALKIFKWQ